MADSHPPPDMTADWFDTFRKLSSIFQGSTSDETDRAWRKQISTWGDFIWFSVFVGVTIAFPFVVLHICTSRTYVYVLVHFKADELLHRVTAFLVNLLHPDMHVVKIHPVESLHLPSWLLASVTLFCFLEIWLMNMKNLERYLEKMYPTADQTSFETEFPWIYIPLQEQLHVIFLGVCMLSLLRQVIFLSVEYWLKKSGPSWYYYLELVNMLAVAGYCVLLSAVVIFSNRNKKILRQTDYNRVQPDVADDTRAKTD